VNCHTYFESDIFSFIEENNSLKIITVNDYMYKFFFLLDTIPNIKILTVEKISIIVSTLQPTFSYLLTHFKYKYLMITFEYTR